MIFLTNRLSAMAFALSLGLFLTVGLFLALPTQAEGEVQATSRGLTPLPGDCSYVTPGDQAEAPVCCAYGYVFVNGEVVFGAEVEISNANGSIRATTTTSEGMPDPHYGASLSDTLQVYPGDLVTFTVKHEGFTIVRTHEAVAGSQQVNLVINTFEEGGQLDGAGVVSGTNTIQLAHPPTEDVKISDERILKRLRPSLVTDSSGHLYAVWEDRKALADGVTVVDRIYSSFSLDGGQSWSESLPVFDDSRNVEQEAPKLLIGSDGVLYVVWAEKDPSQRIPQTHIHFAKSLDGGQSWSDPVRIEDTSIDRALNPTLALDGDGTLYAAWGDGRRDFKADIYFAKSTNGGEDWQESRKINSVSNSAFDSDAIDFTPSFLVAGDGTLYLAWSDNRNGDFDIYFARSEDQGENWSANMRMNQGLFNHQVTPQLIEQDGTLYAVWSDEREGNNKIYLATSTDRGETWSEDVLYEPPLGATQHDPQLVSNDDGQIYVGWRQMQANQNDFLLAHFSNERQKWDLIGQINDVGQALPRDDEFNFSPPSLAIDQSGEHTLYFAWPVGYSKHDVDIKVAAWPDTSRFYSHGTYTSQVYDAQKVVKWLNYDAPTTLSADTSITLDVRTGNTLIPDADWSAWQTFTALPADLTSLPDGQFLQWRTNLSSNDPESSPLQGPPALSMQTTTTETLSLDESWHLISIPGETASNKINDVLNSIEGNYQGAYTYNNCAAGDPWQTYDPDSPPYANTLAEVDYRQGLWLNMKANDTLILDSVVPLTSSIQLCTGWNLVGFPSRYERDVEQALEDIKGDYTIIYAYNPDNGSWKTYDPSAPVYANTLDVMKPKYGYWIHVNQNVEWEISNEGNTDDES